MARFAPFEARPRIAVGVSGGADSLCLIHLAHDWARALGGEAIALTVDHGLRPEAADEARRVAGWMGAAGIAHHILAVDTASTRQRGGPQAAARGNRLALLMDWCRRAGVLHLLLAHHREDQAETLLQRLARGSGVHGLAAITPDKAFDDVRILRPLIDQSRQPLAATLRARGLAWISDPSNRDPRYDRVRLRVALSALVADDALLLDRLAHTAGAMRRSRRILDTGIDALLAEAVTLSPWGYAVVDAPALLGGPRDLASRALGLLIATVAAAGHPPRRESVLRWLDIIASGSGGGTLSGAQLSPWRGRWVIHREPAAVAGPIALAPGEAKRWDDRFACELDASAAAGVDIGPLGRRLDASDAAETDAKAVPEPAQSTLPAARLLDGWRAIPHLNAGRRGREGVYSGLTVAFSPARPLTDPVSPSQRTQTGGADPGVGNKGANRAW